ncbi:MAG: hypothetical protein LBU39_10670 [Desulfobulbaceae bacterium]|jgi:hypothetical protein|nr:hypothetical protein [Desulfobulbaceae bacterium]
MPEKYPWPSKNRLVRPAWVVAVALLLAATNAWSFEESLVIHAGNHATLSDGALAARYHLTFHGENPARACRDIAFFWRPGSIFKPGAAWFALPGHCDAKNCGVDIRIGGIVFFSLLAQAQCGGVQYQAQTIDNLHARNVGPLADATAANQKPAAIRAALELVPAMEHYYPQTGMTFLFHYQNKNENPAAGQVEISSDDQPTALSALDEHGDFRSFRFTPSHDQALNRQGSEATAERVVQVREGANGPVSTFTLNVHRSRRAFFHRQGGMALFAGLAALGAALVVYYKKQTWRR